MNIKKILLVTIAALLIISYLSLSTDPQSSSANSENTNTAQASGLVETELTGKKQAHKNDIALSKQQVHVENEDTIKADAIGQSVGNNNESEEPAVNEVNGFPLSSTESVDNAFLDDQNRVYQSTLEEVFKDKDFNLLINQIRAIEETENSINRETNLGTALNKLNKGNLYGSDHVCRGKICAITFSHNASDEIDVSELGMFDLNYTFKNFVKTETGDTLVKIVYIQTDDPSTLQITNSLF